MATRSALQTIKDYVDDARVLLLDTIAPYRYEDASLVTAMNVTVMEARRLRADLFVYAYGPDHVPFFEQVDDKQLCIEEPFRLGILFGVVGHALMRDQEDVQDARATTYMNDFASILQGSTPITMAGGGTGGGAKR